METSDVVFIFFSILIMSVILVLNLFVFTVCAGNFKNMDSKLMLIGSLSISDLFVGLFIIPNVLVLIYLPGPWSTRFCQLCLQLEHCIWACSAFTIAAMAIDRLNAVVFPIKYKTMNTNFKFLALAFIWACAIFYSFRAPFVYGLVDIATGNGSVQSMCTILPTMESINRTFIVVDFIALYVTPSLVLIVCNIVISLRLNKKSNIRQNTSTGLVRRRKAVRLLMGMIFVYQSLHLPIYSIRLHALMADAMHDLMSWMFRFFIVLTWTNSIINVFFYGFLSTEVKVTIVKLRNKLWPGSATKVVPLPENSNCRNQSRNDNEQCFENA